MSEHLPTAPEHFRAPHGPERADHQQEAPQPKHEHEPRPQAHHEAAQELQKQAEHAALSSAETKLTGQQEGVKSQDHYIGRELKSHALSRTMTRIRKSLSPSERSLSKVTHQPVVDVLSEASAKTIARPSGLLGGSLCAFLGSGALLYLAKHTGFTYNYSLFLLLFAGGFGLGMLIELLIFALKLRKTRR